MGGIVAGYPDVLYNTDVFQQDRIHDNLFHILDFSFKILTEYNNVPYFLKKNIVEYGKQDLFKRFALDSFASLYLLNKDNKLSNYIQGIYSDYQEYLDINLIENRIEYVRNKDYQPNFNKEIC